MEEEMERLQKENAEMKYRLTEKQLGEDRKLKMARAHGYCDALRDYGIWNNGVQTIGCLCTPIKEIIERKMKEAGTE